MPLTQSQSCAECFAAYRNDQSDGLWDCCAKDEWHAENPEALLHLRDRTKNNISIIQTHHEHREDIEYSDQRQANFPEMWKKSPNEQIYLWYYLPATWSTLKLAAKVVWCVPGSDEMRTPSTLYCPTPPLPASVSSPSCRQDGQVTNRTHNQTQWDHIMPSSHFPCRPRTPGIEFEQKKTHLPYLPS